MRLFLNAFLLFFGSTTFAQSTCYGTGANGTIKGAMQLPASGKNFSAYSDAGVALGRAYLHTTVADIVTSA